MNQDVRNDQARQAAAVELPEAVGAVYTIAGVQHCTLTKEVDDTNLYTEAQVREAIAAALSAAAEPVKEDNWRQYAKDGENAQQCIERQRKEQDALLTLLKNSRRPYSDNEEMKL